MLRRRSMMKTKKVDVFSYIYHMFKAVYETNPLHPLYSANESDVKIYNGKFHKYYPFKFEGLRNHVSNILFAEYDHAYITDGFFVKRLDVEDVMENASTWDNEICRIEDVVISLKYVMRLNQENIEDFSPFIFVNKNKEFPIYNYYDPHCKNNLMNAIYYAAGLNGILDTSYYCGKNDNEIGGDLINISDDNPLYNKQYFIQFK